MTVQLKFQQGLAFYQQGRLAEAERAFQEVLQQEQAHFGAQYLAGVVALQTNQPQRCVELTTKAITLNPNFAAAHLILGYAWKALKRYHEALASYDQAIALKPDYAEAHNERGNALIDLRQFEEALASYDRAIALEPGHAQAHNNRGVALKELGRFEEASASYDRAVAIQPDHAEAHWNQGNLFLLLGRFEQGWGKFEWRKKLSASDASRAFSRPVWTGVEDIKGKILFTHANEGLGDTIQFCRCAALAEAKGARVVLSVQDNLMRLIKTLRPTIEIIASQAVPANFDFYIPLLNMPLAFKMNFDTIPATVPYLRAEPDLIKKWNKIGNDGFKIGICWGGSDIATKIGRSFPVSLLEGISKIPNVRLISLQKSAGIEQLGSLPPGMKVETLGEEFDVGPDAFMDTAAVMENLDLIITSDTAIAHLAGALGRPTWIALQHVPDWRWFLERSDSPWYPTMRLFRQPVEGDWVSIFAQMQTQLAALVKSK